MSKNRDKDPKFKKEDKFGDTNFSGNAGTKPKGEQSPKTYIAYQARKGLQFGSVQVKADPYTAALPGSEPYPLVAQFNRVVSPSYKGKSNLDGGNIQQYSYSLTSKYLKAFDYMYMRLNANYNYVPCDPADAKVPPNSSVYPGQLLIDEMRRAITEAGSILGATTYRALAFNSYAIETDLPMGSAKTVEISNTDVYTDFADVFYAFSTFYQLVLQACRLPIKSFNSFRAKMGTMLRTAFNREVPQLNSVFGLFNKNSFLVNLESICKCFEGEYIDTEFSKTLDTMSVMPCRRSNSIFDPVLELGIGLSHPTKFIVHILNSDGTGFVGEPIDFMKLVTIEDIPGTEEPVDIFDIQLYLENELSATDTVQWARSTQYSVVFANDRFNSIKYYYDAINTILTRFKIYVSDFREACQVMARAGIIRWTIGWKPVITPWTNSAMMENRFVLDLYKAAMSSATEVRFNDSTKRWDTFTLWNMYDGIPMYDAMSGGAFLTFSFKQFIIPEDADSTIGYIPKVFSGQADGNYDVYCYMVSRDGVELQVSRGGSEVISLNKVLRRLVPLSSQDGEKIRIPAVNIPNDTVANSTYFSLAYKTLTQIFTTAKVTIGDHTDYALDPDVLSIYQVELEDITNEALNYARAHCVIKGSSMDSGVIGFTSSTSDAPAMS